MPADKYRSGTERVPGCYGGFLLVTTLTSKDTGMDLKVAKNTEQILCPSKLIVLLDGRQLEVVTQLLWKYCSSPSWRVLTRILAGWAMRNETTEMWS